MWVKSELDRLDGPTPVDAAEFARAVPPLLWSDVWLESFSELIVTRADWPARRFLSMQVVKLATQCSWRTAAAALGNRDLQPGVAVGYVNRATREDTADALRRATEHVITALTAETAPVDYRSRREALAELERIDRDAWREILSRAGVSDTSKRRYCAAIWLWCELTGGYPTEAPGWADTPPRAPEMYRQFLNDELPYLREALLDHGHALLSRAGDSQPHRVELTLHSGR